MQTKFILLFFFIISLSLSEQIVVTASGHQQSINITKTTERLNCPTLAYEIYKQGETKRSKQGSSKSQDFCDAGGDPTCLLEFFKIFQSQQKEDRKAIYEAEKICIQSTFSNAMMEKLKCLKQAEMLYKKGKYTPEKAMIAAANACQPLTVAGGECLLGMYYYFHSQFDTPKSISLAENHCSIPI